MGIHLWAYIYQKTFICYKVIPKNTFWDFQVCNIAASIWFPYNLNMKKHFTWRRRECNVMKKEIITLVKYICYNKKLKNLSLCLWIRISKSKIITSIFIKLSGLKIRIFDEVYDNLIFYFTVIFPAWSYVKNSDWIAIVCQKLVWVKIWNKDPDSELFQDFFNFKLKIRIFDEMYTYFILQFAVVFPA